MENLDEIQELNPSNVSPIQFKEMDTTSNVEIKNVDHNENESDNDNETDNENEEQIDQLVENENGDLINSDSLSPDQMIDNALDRLIFRQRQNLAHELRQLRYSSRLVTSDFGQDARVRLESFFLRSVENIPSNQSVPLPTSRFRSQDVQNELSMLSSAQRVSGILNSRIRENIESSLRNLSNNNTNNNSTSANSNNNNSNVVTVQPSIPSTPSTNDSNVAVITLPTDFEQLNREVIMEEISDLVHRQLVSNTLQSEFRQVLEERVMERLRSSGTNGEQTRQLIQELARSNHNHIARNDFSNLGIYPTRARSDSNASSLTDVRLNQQQRLIVKNNSKEIRELKSEINELKSLVKLSFELTLDIQRSFKQEISALIANTFHTTTSTATTSLLNHVPSNEGSCVICTENKVDSVFYECGHMATCYMCSMNLKLKNHNCPVCRAPIKDFIRVYKSNLN